MKKDKQNKKKLGKCCNWWTRSPNTNNNNNWNNVSNNGNINNNNVNNTNYVCP